MKRSLAHLERIGVVAELTRKQRGHAFSYPIGYGRFSLHRLL
jgi:hypothetical protein